MKKAIVSFLILWCAAAGPLPGASGEPPETLTLTLEDCLEMALRQNPFYLGTKEREAQATSLLREAKARFFPSLNAQGTDTLAEKLFVLEFPSFIPGEPPQRIKIDFTKDYQLSLALSQPLFAGGRIVSGYRQANYNLLATREEIRLSGQETVYSVKSAFYGHLLAQEFVRVAEEALELAEKHHQNVQNLYDVGMASKFDLLRSEVQTANLKPQMIRARNGLDVAALNLKMLIGIDLDTPIKLEGDMASVPFGTDVAGAVEEALSKRPELRQMDYQRNVAGEMLKLARASYMPVLSIGAGYNLWADRFNFKKGTWQNFYSVNLSLTFPIFNGFETQARVGQSKALIRELDWTRKGLEEMVKFEVRQAVLNYRQARESLLSQEKNVGQAQEAVRIAELNYTEGLATSLDVSTAQVALSQARTNHSQALYDCAVSLAQLEKAVGRGKSEDTSN